MKKGIINFVEIIFDFMVIFAFRAIIIFIGTEILHKSLLSTSSSVWFLSILAGLIFAECFTIKRK